MCEFINDFAVCFVPVSQMANIKEFGVLKDGKIWDTVCYSLFI